MLLLLSVVPLSGNFLRSTHADFDDRCILSFPQNVWNLALCDTTLLHSLLHSTRANLAGGFQAVVFSMGSPYKTMTLWKPEYYYSTALSTPRRDISVDGNKEGNGESQPWPRTSPR